MANLVDRVGRAADEQSAFAGGPRFNFLQACLGPGFSRGQFVEACAHWLAFRAIAGGEANPAWQVDPLLPTEILASSGDKLETQASGSGIDIPLACASSLYSSRDSAETDEALLHSYEHLLADCRPGRRRRRGAFYTPVALARFVVRSIDERLKTVFELPLGLADATTWAAMSERTGVAIPPGANDSTPFVRILDPAAGTGVFLVAVVKDIHRTMTTAWNVEERSDEEQAGLWSHFVRESLLDRLIGFELMPAACAIARFFVAKTLVDTGYRFVGDEELHIYPTNTLSGPDASTGESPDPRVKRLCHERQAAPATVVLGNPPYSGVSENMNPWIDGLLRGGTDAADDLSTSYYHAEEKPLSERKLWLQDDYVKFLRYSQWRVASNGLGVIGLVTNHGYLDNPSFRGVRESLLHTFSDISLLDLKGNVKKRAQSSSADESVFATEQGVAVGVFCRGPKQHFNLEARASGSESNSCVGFGEMTGSRDQKLARMANQSIRDLATTELKPTPSFYFFYPHDDALADEYERGWRLPDLMPINSTAVVTARDRFVVALDNAELAQRLEDMGDPSQTDDALRERYFSRTRSNKYLPGDSRGWKLVDARRRIQGDPNWRQHVRECLYRPFDRRPIFWTPWMIDWPRGEVTRHLVASDNLALIVRKQTPQVGEYNYVWVTDTIPIDGVIRSDNRGSESVFPLWQIDDEGKRRRPNLADTANSIANLPAKNERLFHYIYALLFSPEYRARYASLLCVDFPRVFFTPHRGLRDKLIELGERLAHSHLLRKPWPAKATSRRGKGGGHVSAGFPKYVDDRVEINPTCSINGVPSDVWRYEVGSHQVCRKWLKDRRGRCLSDNDLDQYEAIVAAITETIEIEKRIDAAIESFGGWPGAMLDSRDNE
jgi:predicted helicase